MVAITTTRPGPPKPEPIPEGYYCLRCFAKGPKVHKMSCDPPYKLRKRGAPRREP